jgi:hypothetical protein
MRYRVGDTCLPKSYIMHNKNVYVFYSKYINNNNNNNNNNSDHNNNNNNNNNSDSDNNNTLSPPIRRGKRWLYSQCSGGKMAIYPMFRC